MVEGNGGPSWYTEYNVLAGLSSRSFGRFSYFVTRIAAGRVERGLPLALKRCGYNTVSLYPAYGAFMSARSFQTTMGIDRFLDARDLGAKGIEPDSFFYNKAVSLIAEQPVNTPLFTFVYLAANHFPWETRFRPDLLPSWQKPGNAPVVDEYLRRQTLSAGDYAGFVATLKKKFPAQPFLIVRYGDHQPEFSSNLLDPGLDEAKVARKFNTLPSHTAARVLSTFDPALSREQIEAALCEYLGAEKVVWLGRGVYEDETDGHVDNLACFAAPGVVLLTWTPDESDPQHEISRAARERLEAAADARGRPFEVVLLPAPGPLFTTDEEAAGVEPVPGTKPRRGGERLAASYANFYVANSRVVMPLLDERTDDAAAAILRECFPGREVVGVPGREILLGGGNVHCITQQVPRA